MAGLGKAGIGKAGQGKVVFLAKQTSFIDEPIQFGGRTYQPQLDEKRLKTALGRVWSLMRDGRRRTLAEVAAEAGCSEAGASARLRDLRKSEVRERYKCKAIHSERVDGGLWVYWMES